MREVSVREAVDGTLSSSTHVPRGSSSSCRGPVHRRSRSRHLRDGVLVEHLVSERVIVELDIVEPVDCCERSALQVPEGLVVRVPIDARVGEREEREEAKSSAPRTNPHGKAESLALTCASSPCISRRTPGTFFSCTCSAQATRGPSPRLLESPPAPWSRSSLLLGTEIKAEDSSKNAGRSK